MFFILTIVSSSFYRDCSADKQAQWSCAVQTSHLVRLSWGWRWCCVQGVVQGWRPCWAGRGMAGGRWTGMGWSCCRKRKTSLGRPPLCRGWWEGAEARTGTRGSSAGMVLRSAGREDSLSAGMDCPLEATCARTYLDTRRGVKWLIAGPHLL